MARLVIWGATDWRYEVYVIDHDGEIIDDHSAGNPAEVGLETMRGYAEQTARETAEEWGAEYGGEDEDTTQQIKDLHKAIEEGRI